MANEGVVQVLDSSERLCLREYEDGPADVGKRERGDRQAQWKVKRERKREAFEDGLERVMDRDSAPPWAKTGEVRGV